MLIRSPIPPRNYLTRKTTHRGEYFVRTHSGFVAHEILNISKRQKIWRNEEDGHIRILLLLINTALSLNIIILRANY